MVTNRITFRPRTQSRNPPGCAPTDAASAAGSADLSGFSVFEAAAWWGIRAAGKALA